MRYPILALLFTVVAARAEWQAKPQPEKEGGGMVESVLPGSFGYFYTVLGPRGNNAWAHDGNGKILRGDGTVVAEGLDGPKGMAVLGDFLYVADVDKVWQINLKTGRRDEMPSHGQRFNDVVTDGTLLYVSDTAAGEIHVIAPGAGSRRIPAPPAVNGLAWHDGKLFGVTWTDPDIFVIDPEGKRAPLAFQLGKHFQSLDGIAALPDGSLVVSDNTGGKVYIVASNRRDVRLLLEAETPADIAVDLDFMLLYVPEMRSGRIRTYQLSQ